MKALLIEALRVLGKTAELYVEIRVVGTPDDDIQEIAAPRRRISVDLLVKGGSTCRYRSSWPAPS